MSTAILGFVNRITANANDSAGAFRQFRVTCDVSPPDVWTAAHDYPLPKWPKAANQTGICKRCGADLNENKWVAHLRKHKCFLTVYEVNVACATDGVAPPFNPVPGELLRDLPVDAKWTRDAVQYCWRHIGGRLDNRGVPLRTPELSAKYRAGQGWPQYKWPEPPEFHGDFTKPLD